MINIQQFMYICDQLIKTIKVIRADSFHFKFKNSFQ